jgi:hypothetical protein
LTGAVQTQAAIDLFGKLLVYPLLLRRLSGKKVRQPASPLQDGKVAVGTDLPKDPFPPPTAAKRAPQKQSPPDALTTFPVNASIKSM